MRSRTESISAGFRVVLTPTRSRPWRTVKTTNSYSMHQYRRKYFYVISVMKDFLRFVFGINIVTRCTINDLNVISVKESLVKRLG